MNKSFRLKPQEVVGPYKIVAPLAQGGMGEVYKAYEPSLHRPVALKVISSSISSDSEFIQRFHSEGRVLAKIIHPNVVTVYSLGNSNGVEYMAMEFVDGKSLLEVIQEKGKFSVELAIPVFRQILSGVSALHEAGILHRDLKPGNIIQCQDGKIKIVDLGIAKMINGDNPDLTAVGEFIGSPRYMAPEVTVGDAPSAQSDIWACGLIFYEMLTARPAYHGKTKIEILKNVRTREITFSATEKSQLPESIMNVILKMACHDPSQRYSNTDEVLEDLLSFSGGKEITSTKSATRFTLSTASGGGVNQMDPFRASTQLQSESSQRSSRRRTMVLILVLFTVMGGVGWYLRTFDLSRFLRGASEEGLKVQLQYPVKGEVFWNRHRNDIQFMWVAPESDTQFNVEISRDRDFKTITYTSTSVRSPFKLNQKMEEGEYFWRVIPHPSSDLNQTHEMGHFQIAHISPPQILLPKENEEIFSAMDAQGRIETHFQWQPKPTAIQYQIQVALDENFKGIVLDEKISETVLQRSFNPGKYFWRIKITSPEFLSADWSPNRSFTLGTKIHMTTTRDVMRASPPSSPQRQLPAPKLVQITSEVLIELKRKVAEKAIASELRNEKRLPVLTWKPVEHAKSYKIEIARNKSFSSSYLLASLKSDTQSIVWNPPSPGTFYWRVLAFDAKGGASPWSEPGKIELFFPEPKSHIQPLREDSSLEVSHLQWNEVLSAPQYLVEVSQNDQFEPVLTKERVQRNVASVKLGKAGKYFARVAVTNSLGEIISPFSKAFSFLLEERVSLTPPKVLVPINGTEIIASMDGSPTPLIFQWSPVSRAKSYQLQFSLDAQFNVVFHSERAASTRFTLNKSFPSGRMYWRMRSEHGSSSSAWTPIYHFDLP